MIVLYHVGVSGPYDYRRQEDTNLFHHPCCLHSLKKRCSFFATAIFKQAPWLGTGGMNADIVFVDVVVVKRHLVCKHSILLFLL